MSNPTPKAPISFHFRIIQHKDDSTGNHQEIGIDSDGQEETSANWRTLGAFVGDGQDSMKKDEFMRLIPIYETTAYGTAPEQTSKPRDLWLQDDAELTTNAKNDDDDDDPTSPFQKYGWQPATITIEPNKKKKHEKWKTKKKVLDVEETETELCTLWDPRVTTNTNNNNDKPKIISYFVRSGNPIFGQRFAPPVTFEFRGNIAALGLCCLTQNDSVLPKTQTIEWVLDQYGGVSSAKHCVHAIKHTVRGKLKYSVRISGTAVGDCRIRGSRTPLYRQFPIDFVLEYNGIPPTTEMYEDFELVYYTNISVSASG